MRAIALVRRSRLVMGFIALLAPAARAQTQISIADCSVTGADFSLSGTCTVTPFGPMTVSLSVQANPGVQTLNIQVNFSSGSGAFSATASNQPYTATATTGSSQGTANITGGTGAFTSASGSFTYSFVGTGPKNNQGGTLSGSGTINVQTVVASLPDAMVGVPYSINVGEGRSQIPAGAQFGVLAGSTLPPGLMLSASGLLSGTPAQAGDYTFSMTFQGTTQSGTLQATLHVTANSGGAVTVNPGVLSFR